MKSTFKSSNGEVLIVQDSPTRAAIWITAINADGARAIVAIPLHLAGVVSQAIEGTATVIEEGCRPELPAGALHPNNSSPSGDMCEPGEGASASSPAELAMIEIEARAADQCFGLVP